MGALQAAARAVSTLRRNPVILLAAVTLALLGLPSYVIQTRAIPLLTTAWAGVAFFVSPFLTGGILGMAAEGLHGRTSLSTFLTEGRGNYIHLLLVALLVAVVVGVVAVGGGMVLGVVGLFVFGVSTTGALDAGAGALLGIGLLALLFLALVLALSFLLQFAAPAVVLDDVGPVDALKQSYRTVRTNVVGAVGVGLIGFLLGTVVGSVPIMLAAFSLQSTPTALPVSMPPSVAYAVMLGWGSLSSTVFGAFNNTLLAAFYDAYAPAL